MFDLGIQRWLLPKDMHGFFNIKLETSGSRVEDFKDLLNKGRDNFQSLSSA